MTKVIDFRAVKGRMRKKEKKTFCDSPIRVEFRDEGSVYIGFHRACFSMPFLEYALRGLAYGEDLTWRLYKVDDEKGRSKYLTYAVVLTCAPCDNDRDILTTVVDRMTKKVYSKEIRCWECDVSVSDLVKPYQYRLGDGTNISYDTVFMLEKAGIKKTEDLTQTTRENLCKIPGMTTMEIARIEKSLASRGLFLQTADVPVA